MKNEERRKRKEDRETDLDVTSQRLVEHPGVGSLRFFDHRIALRECVEGMGLVATVDIPRGTVAWMSDPEGEIVRRELSLDRLSGCIKREFQAPKGEETHGEEGIGGEGGSVSLVRNSRASGNFASI